MLKKEAVRPFLSVDAVASKSKLYLMTSTYLQRVRARTQRLNHALRGDYWFPHVPLALLLGFAGYWRLRWSFGTHWTEYLRFLAEGKFRREL